MRVAATTKVIGERIPRLQWLWAKRNLGLEIGEKLGYVSKDNSICDDLAW